MSERGERPERAGEASDCQPEVVADERPGADFRPVEGPLVAPPVGCLGPFVLVECAPATDRDRGRVNGDTEFGAAPGHDRADTECDGAEQESDLSFVDARSLVADSRGHDDLCPGEVEWLSERHDETTDLQSARAASKQMCRWAPAAANGCVRRSDGSPVR